jgi:hypothetical protein
VEGERPQIQGQVGAVPWPKHADISANNGGRANLRRGDVHPPKLHEGVEDICRAAEACPAGCKLLVMGDLNVNVGFPRDEQEEVIVDLLDKLCVVDLLRRYMLQTPCRTATRARWTWIQKQGATRHSLQPDYILAPAGEKGMLTGVGFCFL